jgi:hypothetical protein
MDHIQGMGKKEDHVQEGKVTTGLGTQEVLPEPKGITTHPHLDKKSHAFEKLKSSL